MKPVGRKYHVDFFVFLSVFELSFLPPLSFCWQAPRDKEAEAAPKARKDHVDFLFVVFKEEKKTRSKSQEDILA